MSSVVGQLAFGINVLFSLSLLGVIFTLIRKQPRFIDYMLVLFSAIVFLYLISASALNMNPILYIIIMLIPMIAAFFMLIRSKDEHLDVKIPLLLTIWFAGATFISIRGGVRFIVLLTPVFAISLGVAVGYLHQYFSRIFHKEIRMPLAISGIVVFLLLCLMLISPISQAVDAAKTYEPSITSGWLSSLNKINAESSPDAIINSWWDFGHWFKYYAKRRVTADGATQVLPQTQWLGMVLQSSDENQSIAILRMLDCGANKAFEEVDKKYNDTDISKKIVDKLIMMNQSGGTGYLRSLGYDDGQIKDILGLTDCNPPEDYFITSEDMVGKAGVWGHFGLWDFDKAYIISNLRSESLDKAVAVMKDRWNYSDDFATKTYYDVEALQSDTDMNNWIAPWPGYVTQNLVDCPESKGTLSCNIGVGIGSDQSGIIVLDGAVIDINDLAKNRAYIGFYDSTTKSRLHQSLAEFKDVTVYNVDGTVEKYVSNNSTLSLSLVLMQNITNDTVTYKGLVAEPSLANSLFTRLFFLDGMGTIHFEKFSEVKDITGQRIIIWKVKW